MGDSFCLPFALEEPPFPAAAETERSAVSQPPTSAKLDFRIAAEIGQEDKPTGNLLPRKLADELIRLLSDRGPRAQFDRPENFDWFETTDGEDRGAVSGVYENRRYLLLMKSRRYTMLAEQEGRRTWGLKSATLVKNDRGLTAIDFEFDAAGAEQFGTLTETNLKRPLAILFGGKVISVAKIMAKITVSVTIIGGSKGFDTGDAAQIIKALREVRRGVGCTRRHAARRRSLRRLPGMAHRLQQGLYLAAWPEPQIPARAALAERQQYFREVEHIETPMPFIQWRCVEGVLKRQWMRGSGPEGASLSAVLAACQAR